MHARRMVLVCQNQRLGGKASCQAAGSAAVLEAFKRILKERGLKGPLRAVGSTCLGQCEGGPHCVVWPDGVWYRGLRPDDAAEVIERHLVGGEPVARLQAPD